MNRISNDKINKYLQEKTDILLEQYPNQIMGTFVIGKANYGLAETLDEIYIVALYLPTFEEICFSNKPFYLYDKENRIVIDDIRNCYTAERNLGKDYLELLTCEYSIIMKPYQKTFRKFFIDKADYMAKYNPKERVKMAKDRALKYCESNPLESHRLILAAGEYSKGEPIWNCFHLDSNPAYDTYLWGIKEGSIKPHSREVIEREFEIILNKVEDKPSKDVAAAIKMGVLAIIDVSLNMNVNSDAFFSCITDTEKIALKAILEEIGDEGNISIAKLVDKTSISRPVFNNLLAKMKTNKVAEVTNHGVKGTNIKVLDRGLLNL